MRQSVGIIDLDIIPHLLSNLCLFFLGQDTDAIISILSSAVRIWVFTVDSKSTMPLGRGVAVAALSLRVGSLAFRETLI
ncbi:hypothetical protein V6N12_058939 [Hibiscus sabdariffa]|uniref:Uncharacterized protein n=1 Tax=Hibiscus sabdariffa TaxID=183260 RepID=A0ABR2ETL3_9ROSI